MVTGAVVALVVGTVVGWGFCVVCVVALVVVLFVVGLIVVVVVVLVVVVVVVTVVLSTVVSVVLSVVVVVSLTVVVGSASDTLSTASYAPQAAREASIPITSVKTNHFFIIHPPLLPLTSIIQYVAITVKWFL